MNVVYCLDCELESTVKGTHCPLCGKLAVLKGKPLPRIPPEVFRKRGDQTPPSKRGPRLAICLPELPIGYYR